MLAVNVCKHILRKPAIMAVIPVRFAHGPCEEDPGPRCDVDKPPKSSDDDCTKRKRISELRKPKLSYVSMWEDPECCRKYTCDDHVVRSDDLYWKPTDKAKREYMQTWAECRKIKEVPKDICIHETYDLCEPERRARKQQHEIKKCEFKDIGLMKCKVKSRDSCPKIKLPRCRDVSTNLKCRRNKEPSNCKKFCTPYPSFSECRWDDMRSKYQDQCGCLILPIWCEVLEEMKKQEKIDKKK